MLEVDHVSVEYGPIRAVRDVSFRVEVGEVLALLGPNGAGKTTLLSAITGLVPVSHGEIRFEGEAITGRPPEDVVRLGVTMAPEGRQVFSKLTVAENLWMGGAVRSESERRAARADVLDLFPVLAERLDDQAETLSGGQQQQLAIGRAVMGGPRLLALDEPSLGLAPHVVDTIFGLLERLVQEGLTILLVEQDAMRAMEVADRAVLLSAGEVEATGSSEELAGTGDLMRAYFGDLDPAES